MAPSYHQLQHDPLTRIAALTQELHDLERRRQTTIAQALQAGHSWAQIALSLNISPQAAHKRYRWLHHSALTGETWHEPPLPL
jgi:DNA-binding NarL/FixJ family response regulator